MSIGGASIWMIDRQNDESKDATWKFVKFMVSAESQAKWNRDTGYYPVTTEAHETDIFNVEQVGSDTYVYFNIGDYKDEFVARFNPPRDIELNERIYIKFDKEKIFLFDYKTEESLFI